MLKETLKKMCRPAPVVMAVSLPDPLPPRVSAAPGTHKGKVYIRGGCVCWWWCVGVCGQVMVWACVWRGGVGMCVFVCAHVCVCACMRVYVCTCALCALWRWQRRRWRRRQQHLWSGFVAALLDGGGDSSSTQIVVAAYSLGASSSRASTPTSLGVLAIAEVCSQCVGAPSECARTPTS
jgi:hypothetical protein